MEEISTKVDQDIFLEIRVHTFRILYQMSPLPTKVMVKMGSILEHLDLTLELLVLTQVVDDQKFQRKGLYFQESLVRVEGKNKASTHFEQKFSLRRRRIRKKKQRRMRKQWKRTLRIR